MTLQDICELIVDCPHITDNDEGFGYPLIRTPNVGRGMLLLENVHRVSKDVYDRRNKRAKPQPYDLILAREAPAGNVALIREGQNVCLGQRTVLIRPNKKVVVPEYLTYYLLAPYNQHRIKESANGSTVEHVNMPNIRGLEIVLPALDIQKRIASILSNYDTLIDINTKRIKLLEESARELYKEWFVRMRFPGHEKTKFVKGIPEGWKLYSIQELCDINKKTFNSKNKSEIIHYLDTSSITDNSITAFVDFAFAEAPSRARRVVKHNSILFSTVRPNLRHLGILKNPVVNTVVSTGFVVFDCKYNIANIVYNFISSDEVVDYCQSIAEGAVATYPSIKPEEIARLKIALPPIHIAEELNGKIETFISEQKNLQLQNQNLATTRDRLLPRLLSGELKVKA